MLLYLHLPEDRGPIVGDHHFPVPALNHLVHSPGAQTGTDRICYRLGGDNVSDAHILFKAERQQQGKKKQKNPMQIII